MTNSYYNHGTYPTQGAAGTSAAMRAELDLLAAAFDLLPSLTTNANKLVIVNAGSTALGVSAATLTAAGALAGITTINGNTWATGTGTLSIAGGKTFTSSNTLTLTGTDGSTLAIGTGGTLGTAAYTASTAYDVAGAAAAVTPTTLGLVIGTNVQAYDADLTTWAGVTPGTGVATALAVAVGSAGAFVTNGGALGTPSSGTLTNATGLPAAGVTGTALVAAAIGTTVQAYDADLTTWAGITPGANVGTALTVAVGTDGAFVVKGGALGSPSSAGTIPAFTLGGDQTLSENCAIVLDAVLSADGKYSGVVEAGTSAAALAFGEVCYKVTATGKWNLARAAAADVGTVVATGELGMCVLAAAGADAATTMLKYGKCRADALFDTFTVGAPVYLSAATAGKTVSAAPTGTTDFTVRKLGHAEDANTVFFNPSNNYFTLT